MSAPAAASLLWRDVLTERLRAALAAAGLPADEALVVPATDRRFGDYQSNAALVLAKQQKRNPREVAGDILSRLEVDDLCEPPTQAGAGFLNFRLLPAALNARLQSLAADPRLGVPAANPPQKIIVDFSSPNVAKPMHVGHIRSTILGDCLARIARFLGHDVVTDNHLGDWGTQFGKIIYGWKHLLDESALATDPIPELLRLYREVNALEAADPAVAKTVREELVRLQQGDPENRRIWQQAVDLSWQAFTKLYQRLDITFDEHLGESFYHDRLAPLVERLLASGLAELSEGAVCIFFPDIPALADKPCLIRKSDGGFLYATTDLATLEYRQERWQPDAVWYVTGAPQALHFQQVFTVAERMGLTLHTRHVAFGSILGEDRKIMKTRSGDNVQLGDVLDEAVTRARAIIREKNPALDTAEADLIAEQIGIGAVKYAELSQHRLTDYVFSWEKMLAFQGNTAPYLQYAHVRIRSIFRKLETPWSITDAAADLRAPEEIALALRLSQYGEAVSDVLDDFRPNLLTNYLYELANTFHSFFEACPVLKADPAIRHSRLLLCDTTARVLAHGLGLLGIHCPPRM
jgi:arginyl-tRNA synthetase